MENKDLKTIISAFGIQDTVEMKQIHKSAWDIDGKYILKKSGSRADLDKSISLCGKLLSMHIPVAEYQKTSNGEAVLIDGETNYCLMKRITGVHLDPYSGDCRSNGRMLGGIAANLHLALKNIDIDFEIYDSDYAKELDGWIMPEIEQKHLVFDDGVLSDLLTFEKLYRSLPRQLIHRDMHLGNMLFKDGVFSGYLDFDISQKNARLLDVCYLGASMLAENYTDETRLKLWREIFAGVLEGYNQTSPLTDDEKQAIPMVFVLIEVTFTAFFSRNHQPEVALNCIDMANWSYRNKDILSSIVKTGTEPKVY